MCAQQKVHRSFGPAVLLGLMGAAATVGAPLGPPNQFPAEIDLASLDGANGFVIHGILPSDRAGASVSTAGDVNGDGFDDFIVGAHFAHPNEMSTAGQAYIVFGGPGVGSSGVLELSVLNGSNGFIVNGIAVGHWLGYSVSPAGDINGDGIDDIAIGAVNVNAQGVAWTGTVYIVFGGLDVGASGSVDLAALDGSNGFTLDGWAAFGRAGASIASLGDVNGDGFDDVALGAPAASQGQQTQAGSAYVVFGGPGVGASGSVNLGALSGIDGFVVQGVDQNDFLGIAVSSAGDLNHDGIRDIAVGARGADPNGMNGAGESYIIFGRDVATDGAFAASIGPDDLDGSNGFSIEGRAQFGESGCSIASCSDFNLDGVDDLVIGARSANTNGKTFNGESYVLFGGETVGASGLVDLSSINGTDGFALYGIDDGDGSGFCVSSAGDFNGDGIADVLIGALDANPNGLNNAGATYLVLGGSQIGASGSFDLASINGINGFVMNGAGADDRSGRAVAPAGDVNGDGIDDILIGARNADPDGRTDAGAVYVVFGRRATPIHCPADIDGDAVANTDDFIIMASHFGETVPAGTLGDLNGDGVVNAADFVILAEDFGCGP